MMHVPYDFASAEAKIVRGVRRVAVVGAGVSGLGAASALAKDPRFAVTLYEAGARCGGHANTIAMDYDGVPIDVDVGFIVYNELNYPKLTALFADLGTVTDPSDMSFAFSLEGGRFEWAGRDDRTVSGLFAQRRHFLSPRHWRFLGGVVAFQKRARAAVAAQSCGDATLGAWLEREGFSGDVTARYVAPMGAAIWSTTPNGVLEFPARAFFAFFDNHRLLQWDRPRWRTVRGGSRRYVETLVSRLGPQRMRLDDAVSAVRREANGVRIVSRSGEAAFDDVVLAVHAPEALRLLGENATPRERAIIGALRTTSNRAVLHRDLTQMPKRRAAWASWNVLRTKADEGAALTYWMNRLQNLDERRPLFVTLNPRVEISAAKTFGEFRFEHPYYDEAAIQAQGRLGEVQGAARVRFAGAWTGWGFHEDGLKSGLEAAAALVAEVEVRG